MTTPPNSGRCGGRATPTGPTKDADNGKDGVDAVQVVDFLRALPHDPAMRFSVSTVGGRCAGVLRWTSNEIVAHSGLDGSPDA